MGEERIMRGNPILYKRKAECCGCSACYAICPTNSILLEEDEEGFYYPIIHRESCIRCYQCVKVCPIKVIDAQNGNVPRACQENNS